MKRGKKKYIKNVICLLQSVRIEKTFALGPRATALGCTKTSTKVFTDLRPANNIFITDTTTPQHRTLLMTCPSAKSVMPGRKELVRYLHKPRSVSTEYSDVAISTRLSINLVICMDD